MSRDQKIDALLGCGKIVAERYQFDRLTDAQLDDWCTRILGRADGRVSRADGGGYSDGPVDHLWREDSELRELEKHFDASLDFEERYSLCDAWKHGEEAAWAAATSMGPPTGQRNRTDGLSGGTDPEFDDLARHFDSVMSGHGDYDPAYAYQGGGVAALSPAGVNRSMDPESRAALKASVMRGGLSRFISEEEFAAMSDAQIEALDAAMRAAAEQVKALGGSTGATFTTIAGGG